MNQAGSNFLHCPSFSGTKREIGGLDSLHQFCLTSLYPDGSMSMHICSMHLDVLFASEQSSWQVVSRLIALVCFTIDGIEGCTICNTPISGAYHHDSGISTEHFEHICRPTPLPSRKKHKTARPHLNTHSTNQQGIFLDIFLIHYSKEIFGRGHEAYEYL